MAALLAIRPPYTMRGRWLAAYRDWRRGRRDLEPGQTPAQLALMTIQRIGRIGAIPTEVMDVRVRSPIGRKPSWWQVAGKTCIAAYQPKGAASLEASYVNLANPGTYDAAPGVAPTWASATGLGCDGTQYLETGIQPAAKTWSMLVRVTNSSGNGFRIACGYYAGINSGFAIFPYGASGSALYIVNGQENTAGSAVVSGVIGVADREVYVDGSPRFTLANQGTIGTGTIKLGGHSSNLYVGNIQAVAIYSATLTAGEVAVVSAAMAAL